MQSRSSPSARRSFFDQLPRALADVDSALNLDPESALARCYRAIYYSALGRSRDAEHELLCARRTAPGLPWTQCTIGELQLTCTPERALARDRTGSNPEPRLRSLHPQRLAREAELGPLRNAGVHCRDQPCARSVE